MGDELKGGDLDDGFAGSMAEAIEDALNDLLDDEDKPRVSTDDTPETRDRRIMFVAIAQGVVNHLVANPGAFNVTEDSAGTHSVSIEK